MSTFDGELITLLNVFSKNGDEVPTNENGLGFGVLGVIGMWNESPGYIFCDEELTEKEPLNDGEKVGELITFE